MNSMKLLTVVLLIAWGIWLAPAQAASSVAGPERVQLKLELANPIVKTGEAATSYLKVGLIGKPETEQKRAPVNVALVIDRSGSMAGEKLEHAKQAAMMFVDRLSQDDILSVVAYDSVVEVVIPATKVTDREDLRAKIMSLNSRGNTALFAGVSKGAAEIRKFNNLDMVSRIILLSDGLANVGPSSPDELSSLGRSLRGESISVSTIGLGVDYNEDLMYGLAAASDGATAFAEQPNDLAAFFDREIRAVTHVVASNIQIELNISSPYRPVKVLGNRGTIRGQQVTFDLNQVYGDWENYFIVELDLPARDDEAKDIVADCSLKYRDLLKNIDAEVAKRAEVSYTADGGRAASAVNHAVMAQAVKLVANENNTRAMQLRDAGRVKEAERMLLDNAYFISTNAVQLPQSYQEDLKKLEGINVQQSGTLGEMDYSKTRKGMREQQQVIDWAVYDK